MSEKKEIPISNIEDAIIKKMHVKGHYPSMLERFDILRIKFIYDKLDSEEAKEFILLIKYLKLYGHSESIKLTCHYLWEKYIRDKGI